jgi:hypothetical protein
MEVLSNVEAQVMFDDMRQLVAVNSLVVPQITWHDVTLRHQRLATAVPVGRSLVADPARTGLFLLDLAHEIGHAFVLQGPIGMRQAAFRAAIHYLELELLNAFPQGEMLSTTNEIQVSSELPDGTRAQALAETQAAVALRAAIEQAVWTPWLEGVSMYIELLCDPKDDPTEISGVHSCIRSLIDFNIPQDDGESSDDYLKRFADMAAQQFEDFFSKVLRKRARLNLLSYLDDAQGTRRVRSDMYCLGFLIVRSVVSAWEATLGARLAPVVALKLLLNATKGATFDAFPDARDIDAHYMELCQINFFAWLKNLASLSKHILADFFVAVRPSEVGASWIWKDGIPYKNLESSTEADEENARRFNELNELAVALSAGKSTSPLPTYSVRTETVLELVNQYLAWNRLLPVGRDRARLLFFDSPGRVGLCIRSYTGDVNLGTGAEKAYRNDPRYNHTVWTLKGGKNEADQLRRACGTAGSARLLTTRIIDFGGLLDSPSPSGSTSYLCSFLKSEFARIVPWSTHVDIASAHPKFVKLLESRVFPPLTFADEENTLASLSFLARRLEKSSSGHSVSSLAMSIDFHKGALDVAMEASAMAFSQSSVNFFRESYEQTMNTTDGRLAFARAVFATGVGQPAPVEAMLHGKSLPTIILDSQSPSGIRRFGAAS